MRHRFLCAVFFICLIYNGTAQTTDNLTKLQPSPNVSGFIKDYQIENNMYNGSLNFTIPIYTYEEQDFKLPIYLSYSGGGIKPDQLPGWVGIGWNLTAGGFITRNVKNQPDEYSAIQTLRYVISGQSFSDKTVSSYDPSYITNRHKLSTSSWNSASFLNTLNTNSPYYRNYGDGSSLSNANPLDDLEPDEFIVNINGMTSRFSLSHTGEWVSVSDGNEVAFKVEPVLATSVKPVSGSSFYIPRAYVEFKLTGVDGTQYFFGENSSNNPKNVDFSYEAFYIRNFTQYSGPVLSEMPSTWHLTKIITKVGKEINFNYKQMGYQVSKVMNLFGRNPHSTSFDQIPSPRSLQKFLTNTWFLEKITTPTGAFISFDVSNSNQLSTDENVESGGLYFYDNNSPLPASIQTARNSLPKLNSVKVSNGSQNVSVHTFEYIDNTSERLKLKFLKLLDERGVSQMEYVFDYNLNKLPAYGSTMTDHWGYFNNVDFFVTTPGPYTYSVMNPGYSLSRNSNFMYSKNEILEKVTIPTKGMIEFQYQPNIYSQVAKKWPFTLDLLNENKEAGGVRIHKVITKGINNEVINEKEYLYTQPNSTLSSGILANPIETYIVGNSSSFSFRAEGFKPFNDRGGVVVYPFVTEKIAGNGYTTYQYSNFSNSTNDQEALTVLPNGTGGSNFFANSYNNRRGSRGKLKWKTVYDEFNNKIAETEAKYTHENTGFKLRNIHFLPAVRWDDNIHRAAAYETDFISDLPKEQLVSQFTPSGAVSEKIQTEYDVYNNPKHVYRYNLPGKRIHELYKYTYEYNTTGNYDEMTKAMTAINNKNIKNALVEKLTMHEGLNGEDPYLVDAVLYTYPKGKFNIEKIYTIEITEPVALTQFIQSYTNSGVFFKDPKYTLKTEFTVVDDAGKSLEVISEGNKINSFIWGYNKKYVIAEVNNASYSDIGYTSFETDENGNWGFSYAMITNTQGGITGKKAYDLNGGIWKNDLQLNKQYRVSFWIKGDKPGISITDVNGNNVYADNNFIYKGNKNGWNLWEGIISNASTIGIWKWGHVASNYLDELRIMPADAQMVTYTYKPLVGMTSQTDINNRTVYYEYDLINRLHIIRDDEKRIVKKICYNYAGQIEECNTFYNSVQNGTFTKNNCDSGYAGSNVTYTVAADTYSAATQLAANSLAQNDVVANGQAYANSKGTCYQACTISFNSGYYNVGNGINSDGTTVSFGFAFFSYSTMDSGGTPYVIGTINGGCKPSAQRTVYFTSSGRSFTLVISTSGQMTLYITAGTSVPPNNVIGTPTLTYNL